jgi:hypothetical protein
MAPNKSLMVRSGIMTSFCLMVVTPSLDVILMVIVVDVNEMNLQTIPAV